MAFDQPVQRRRVGRADGRRDMPEGKFSGARQEVGPYEGFERCDGLVAGRCAETETCSNLAVWM